MRESGKGCTVSACLKVRIFSLFIFASPVLFAETSERFTWRAEDFSLYPDYCRARLDRRAEALRDAWIVKLGRPYFVHMHHYCFGLKSVSLARASFASKSMRSMHAKNALSEFNYVLSHTDEGFPLLADLHFNQAVAYSILGDIPSAERSFSVSTQLNPTIVHAWVSWSDVYFSLGDKKKALAVLERVPDSLRTDKRIRLRLEDLRAP